MSTYKCILLVSLLALLVRQACAAPAAATGVDPVGKKEEAAATPTPEKMLKQSMTPEAVRKIMGNPDSIKPLKTPEGKAEVWTYRRVVDEHFSREQAGSDPVVVSVPDSRGVLRQYTVGENVRFVDVKLVTEDVIELLIFNGRYVTQKTTRREYKRLG